jgi:hypothetical protein
LHRQALILHPNAPVTRVRLVGNSRERNCMQPVVFNEAEEG